MGRKSFINFGVVILGIGVATSVLKIFGKNTLRDALVKKSC